MTRDKEKYNKYMREFRAKNKDRINSERRIRYANDSLFRDKLNESAKSYILNNYQKAMRSRVNYNRKFRKTVKGKFLLKLWNHKYHTEEKSTFDVDIKVLQMVYEDNIKRYGTLTCYLCLEPIEFGKDDFEHKTPISRGGNNEYHNLGIACRSCNVQKFDKTVEEYQLYLSSK